MGTLINDSVVTHRSSEPGRRRRALVVGHDHVAGLGHLGAVLLAAGYTLTWLTVVPAERFLTPDVVATYPEPSRWELIVTLGAPWPVERITSWTDTEIDLLRRAHALGVPILGICFGAQLLAEALGGGSEPMRALRLGWHDVTPHDVTPLGAPLVPAGPWFQWHTDRLILPPDAEVLATSEDGPEAYRVGSSVGVQFHPEMTPDLLEAWLRLPGSLDAMGDHRQLAALREDTVRHHHGCTVATRALVAGLHQHPSWARRRRP